MSSETKETAPATVLPTLNKLAAALSHPIRWRILKELTSGEPRMVSELAKAVKCSPDMASNHLAKLQAGGLVVQGRGRLYQIPKQMLQATGAAVVDCGLCALRLDSI
jgi:DNA-binding transcriptional ArsR family regulator